jgi:hypothetical protein
MVVAIAEAQLETWSAQGKTGQFTDTYNAISAWGAARIIETPG